MKQDPQLQAALNAAIPHACRLTSQGRIGESLAALSAFLCVTLEKVPPKQLEQVLRVIETHAVDELHIETIHARRKFCEWIRAEMADFRLHGFGENPRAN